MTTKLTLFWFLIPVAFLLGCKEKKSQEAVTTDGIAYSVKKIFPHNQKAFTQGLTVADGKLFESTGQTGSWIADVDIATGLHEKKIVLDNKYFGEGITILNNKIYQLTWQNHVGFVYDLKTFEKLREFQYDYEGWGITANDKNLIVSDGSSKIRFLDTLTLKPIRDITVKDGQAAVDNINELEFIDGFIFANRWQTNYILKIDPLSGKVVGRMDLSALAEKMYSLNPSADVLNGIAYERKSKLLLVTGKLWPALFAIKIK